MGCNQSDELSSQPEKIEGREIELATKPLVQQNSTTYNIQTVTQQNGIEPTNLSITSINLEASISAVGLLESGVMEVPKDVREVGWFEPGAKPGQSGNVVLAGHVDNYLGPGIFSNLNQVSIDDKIIVSDGENHVTYKVINVNVYPYDDDGPIEEIFGFTSQKRLHLITCTGTYNPFKRTHEERLVVTAIEE